MSAGTRFGGGGYYAYDEPSLERAEQHGCLDEDVNTGDPLVCRECAYPAGRVTDERGTASSGGLVSSIVVVIAIIVGMRLAFDTDPITWLDAACDWLVETIRDIAADIE